MWSALIWAFSIACRKRKRFATILGRDPFVVRSRIWSEHIAEHFGTTTDVHEMPYTCSWLLFKRPGTACLIVGDRVNPISRRQLEMKLPIDTVGLTFMCASEPEPVLDFETKNPKADENGEPLYGLQVGVASVKRSRTT